MNRDEEMYHELAHPSAPSPAKSLGNGGVASPEQRGDAEQIKALEDRIYDVAASLPHGNPELYGELCDIAYALRPLRRASDASEPLPVSPGTASLEGNENLTGEGASLRDAERPDRGIAGDMLKWGSVFSLAIAGSIWLVIEHYAHSAALFAAACFFLLVWREMDGGKESNV